MVQYIVRTKCRIDDRVIDFISTTSERCDHIWRSIILKIFLLVTNIIIIVIGILVPTTTSLQRYLHLEKCFANCLTYFRRYYDQKWAKVSKVSILDSDILLLVNLIESFCMYNKKTYHHSFLIHSHSICLCRCRFVSLLAYLSIQFCRDFSHRLAYTSILVHKNLSNRIACPLKWNLHLWGFNYSDSTVEDKRFNLSLYSIHVNSNLVIYIHIIKYIMYG